MTVESVTVHVPHALYARFEERARQTQRSVEHDRSALLEPGTT